MTSTLTVRTHDGRALRVVEGGDRSGWPIIVHHGTPMCGDHYPPAERYSREHGIRLVGYDRPGYGESDPCPGRLVASVAGDVTTITDHLGIEKFSVWGHSGGGPHALACAAMLPGRVASAVASASVTPFAAKGLDWMAGMGEGNLREFGAAVEGREALERYLTPEWEAMRAEKVSDDLSSLLSKEDFELLTGELGQYMAASMHFALEKSMEGWVEDDLAFLVDWGFDLANVEVPTSIWHGKLDRFVPYAHGVWLSDHVPRSELHSFDQETHLTLVDRRFPEIARWLKDRARGR